MERKIRVAAVDYLNTKPLIYGFEKNSMQDQMQLVVDYPANIANMLLHDEVDIALVPIATIPLMKESHVLPGYCIGCDGEVASVCLFSEVPLQEIQEVFLDYQSRTSVALFRILSKAHWNIAPILVEAKPGYEYMIKGTTAALVIGDRALKLRKHSKYIYDLGIAWKDMTGLPFVFAAWVSRKELPTSFIKSFTATTGEGLQHLEQIVAAHPFPEYNLFEYYTRNIDYRLDAKKMHAMDLFVKMLLPDK